MDPLSAVPGGGGPAPKPVLIGFFVIFAILAVLVVVSKVRRK
jgi:hypothetical protein